MTVTPQHSTAVADSAGAAAFFFPDVPQGELWCGTITIPTAPATAFGLVYASGELLGIMFGPGIFGPYIAGATRRLGLLVDGLTPHTQYQAIWHADDKGQVFSTYPAPVATSVLSGGETVTVANFPAVQTIDGDVNVDNLPGLAGVVQYGALNMNGTPQVLPSETPAPTLGVFISALKANAHPIYVGGDAGLSTGEGLELVPGTSSPLLGVIDSGLIYVIGTSGDVASFLVT